MIWFLVFNATFINISATSWQPVLMVEEAGENHRPWTSNLFGTTLMIVKKLYRLCLGRKLYTCTGFCPISTGCLCCWLHCCLGSLCTFCCLCCWTLLRGCTIMTVFQNMHLFMLFRFKMLFLSPIPKVKQQPWVHFYVINMHITGVRMLWLPPLINLVIRW